MPPKKLMLQISCRFHQLYPTPVYTLTDISTQSVFPFQFLQIPGIALATNSVLCDYTSPSSVLFSSVQSLSCVRCFVTPWTAAHHASLSITNSRSLLKLMSIESVMPSNHLILCRSLFLPPSIFPRIRYFQMSQLFVSGGQSIGVSASASVLPMNTQD